MESSKDPLSDSRQASVDSSRALAVKSPQYLQLTNPSGTESEYVPDGWSWGGFSFGVFWLMRHRVWRSILMSMIALIFGGVAMLGAVRYLGNTDIVKTVAAITLATLALLHLFLGRRGNLWRQSNLVERGWTPVRKIFAKNVDEAMEVGESALSDLSVHRVAAATKENDPPRSDLPELRPLLKTGEPEIRTVRRPEPTEDSGKISEDMGSMNDLLGRGPAKTETKDTQVSQGSDALTSPDAKPSAKSDLPNTDKETEQEEFISDTSGFEAPLPFQNEARQTVDNQTVDKKTEPAEQPSEWNMHASSRDESKTSSDSKPTTSSMAASMAASVSNSVSPAKQAADNATKTSNSETGPASGGSEEEAATTTEFQNNSEINKIKKQSRFGNSAEDLFEKTLGAPRRRSNTDESTENTELRGTSDAKTENVPPATDVETKTPQESIAANLSIDAARQNLHPQREQRTDRIRVEPTLHTADSSTARTDGSAASDGADAEHSRRRIENENNELFEVAWTEIEKGKMVSALEARALSQHPDNADQRKALYIRMRVAQLKEEKLLAREEIASQRRRQALRVAELEREEVYRDFVQIIQPDYAELRRVKSVLANFADSSDGDTNLSLKTLNDSADRIGMTVVFAPMAGYVAEARDGRMLELGNRDQLNEFLLVLMNSDQSRGEDDDNVPPAQDVPPQAPPRPI